MEEMDIVFDWIQKNRDQRVELLSKIDNTTHRDILNLRNLAAEHGFEMTPNEVKEILMFMKEAFDE